jgi:adenosylmethionine-8-amino-7-oxononanoate aminotransferase
MTDPIPAYEVESASGVRIRLADGRELIDGMASWWCAIHGYNHPALNRALDAQAEKMAHVMFGGLTHEPAVRLAQQLLEMTPGRLQHIFFADSGSVAVEVAIKMAIQYWFARGRPKRSRLLTIRGGYHGDTFGAMSVCDPVTGMHAMFADVLPRHLFADRPGCRFGEPARQQDIDGIEALLRNHQREIAAVILEPIVQGAGGMWFYSADYLRRVAELCREFDVLLIADEIATGFGRTGTLFAVEHAGIEPDILCIGKALTGGYLSLAATLTTGRIAHGISARGGVLMHGPTFMANPLAVSVASKSIELLLASPWRERIQRIESQLRDELAEYRDHASVREVRVLGGIGVIECHEPVSIVAAQERFVEAGVWIRPFGNLVYLMPPYIIEPPDLTRLTKAIGLAL